MRLLTLLSATLLLSGSALAQASEPFSHFGGQVGIGTTGPGLSVVTNVMPNLNLRVSASVFTESLIPVDIDADLDIDGNRFNLDNEIDYFQTGVRADYYPVGSLFVSGGLFYAKRDLNSTISALDPITQGSVTFTPEQIGTLQVTGKFGSTIAPYVGLGFGNPAKATGFPVGFSFELGGYYHGPPGIQLAVNDPTTVIAPSATAANERALEDRLGWYKFYPEVSVGVTFRIR